MSGTFDTLEAARELEAAGMDGRKPRLLPARSARA